MTDILPAALGHADRSFPRLHPRPAQGWVNDPNGILFTEGRWHLFFQYNPASARHEHICWGHMSSPDLVHWQEHPLALRPQAGGPDSFGCWSGVGIVDGGVPTAVYSGVVSRSPLSEVVIARGSADAEVWTQTGLIAAGVPDDPEVAAVRDPFLFELGGRRWALQGAALSGRRGALLLYGADDLENWEYHGVFLGTDDEAAARWPASDVWECPQLVRSGDDWVLLVSHLRYDRSRPHAGVGYLVGSLAIDERSGLPVFTARSEGLIDDGVSFYAPQAVQSTGEDGQGERVLLWGWIEELTPQGVPSRTQEESDVVGWSGALSFPRELTVVGDAVELRPARELTALRAEPCEADVLPDQSEIVLRGTGAARLRLAADGEDGLLLWTTDLGEAEEVRVLLDASVIEIHRAGGATTTLRAYPADGRLYRLETDPGVVAEAWRLGIPA